MRPLPTWVLAGLIIFGGLVVSVSAISDEPGSAFTGTTPALVEHAREQELEVRRLVGGPTELGSDAELDPERTVYVAAGVDDGYTDGQRDHLLDFLEAGGHILLAENFGNANTLTVPLGLTFERVRVVQEDPNITARLDGRAFSLTLGNATAIHVSPDAEVTPIATSSPPSFLDRDGDGLVRGDEPAGPFLLGARVSVGDGELIALGSPELLTHPARPGSDAGPWAKALLGTTLPDGGHLAIDEGHGATSDPLLQALGLVVEATTSAPWRYVFLLAALLIGSGMLLVGDADHAWTGHTFDPTSFVSRQEILDAEGQANEGDTGPQDHSDWTLRGHVALFGGGFLVLAGLVWGNLEATTTGSALLTFAAWSLLVEPPNLEAERVLSANETSEGALLHAELTISNAQRQPVVVEIHDVLEPTFQVTKGHVWQEVRLPSSGDLEIAYEARPMVRGPRDVGPLRVQRRDLLDLRRHEMHLLPPEEVVVEPRSLHARSLPYQTKRPTTTLGPHMVNRSGDGSEFHSLRDYQQGDSYRNINWKASARSDDFMVNQRVHESMATLFLFLDTRRITGAGPMDASPIVQGSRIALSTVEAATKVRERVHVVLYGDGVQEVPPGPRSDQLHQLRSILGQTPADGETTLAQAVEHVRDDLKSRSPLLVVSGLEGDPTVGETVRDLRVRGALPAVVALPVYAEGMVDGEAIAEPGAEEILASRESTVSDLRSRGVRIYDASVEVPLEHLFRLGGT